MQRSPWRFGIIDDVTALQALALGILQGLGEFLPISSSGHLIVVPWLMGWPPQGLAFDVALHLGTLAAVLYAFARDWWVILTSAWRGLRQGNPFKEPAGRLLGLLAVACVPGVVAGLALEDWADTVFRSPVLVAVNLGLMGFVLYVADRRAAPGGGDPSNVTWRDALLIGAAQAVALVPGVSRSGATISMALFLGYRRDEAARFSFLLAMPITLGAAILKVPDLAHDANYVHVVIGTAAAAIVGFLSIRLLLAYVRTKDYRPFVYYRWAFALLVLAVVLVRRSQLG
jgi:undecaprenyl-diphosphatase